MDKINSLSLTDARDGLKKGLFSSLELTRECFNRIEKIEPRVKAFVSLDKESSLEKARQADTLLSYKDILLEKPFLGIPISIKDNYCTKEFTTTASSNVLKNYRPPYNATVVNKLEDAGAIIIGKTNMDAWAHGSSTETSDFFTTKNPWDTEKLPGGSSGGSAASVSSDEVIASIGSETAGSIRQPASWCGIVGFKPTYGRVSRYGVIAMGSSLDSPGPMTKRVADAALIIEVIAGADGFDATASDKKVEKYTDYLSHDLKNLTIGISDDYFKVADSEVADSVNKSLEIFAKKGIKIKKVSLFDPAYAIGVYTILQRSEVSSNLGRYDGIRYGEDRTNFGEEAKRRIMLGTYCLSAGYYDAYYLKAQKVRTLIIENFKKVFGEVDAIIGPTTPSVALPVGSSKNNPMFGEVADVLVEPSTIAGLPGINLPSGLTKDGLPIGMQIIGPQFSEGLLIGLGNYFEKETLFYKNKPKI